MAVLTFFGDHVAFFGGITDNGTSTSFTGVNNPFLSTDIIEIEIPDSYLGPNGEFDPNDVEYLRVTVIRDGTSYDFNVDPGSRIRESDDGSDPRQGDSFFTTHDPVDPPPTGPFSGLPTGDLVFSINDTFTTGQTTTIERYTDLDNNYDGDTTDAGESGDGNFNASQPVNPACYALGTLIDTPDGPRAVETLRAGDLVSTLDNGPQEVRWVRSGDHSLEEAGIDDKPVLLQAGALGAGRPAQDLIVSPQHRIIVGGGGQLMEYFDTMAFAPAKTLTGLPGIRHMKGKTKITYVHFACDRHEVVTANGCQSESLLLGPMVLNGLTRAERSTLTGIFVPVTEPGAAMNGPAACACLRAGEVRRQLVYPAQLKLSDAAKEIRKWDVDAAMERYEAERLRASQFLRADNSLAKEPQLSGEAV